MILIKGAYSEAKIFTEQLEPSADQQLRLLCNQPFTAGSKIRIMPDVHAGAGCTIGTTMTVQDQIVPNLVGVDIGCGMETVRLKQQHIELQRLDKLIYEKIPSGFAVRQRSHAGSKQMDLHQLRCAKAAKIKMERALCSLGTLGGGNHFIEVDKDEAGSLYLVIHSGSRHLGLEVAKYYQHLAYETLRSQGNGGVNKELAWLSGAQMEDYLHDVALVQQFAALNRQIMMQELVRGMKLGIEEQFSTIHNYVDVKQRILRKGAISARKGETVLIPMNMRDGSLLCQGKGNDDWNQSAPHGAGRLMGRRESHNHFTVSQFQKEMAGIYSTSVREDTLDECPMVYKPMEQIISQIGDTVEIKAVIKPIYNFKAGGNK